MGKHKQSLLRRQCKDNEALDAITAIMDGQPWNSDTLHVIAAIIRGTRRPLDPRPET